MRLLNKGNLAAWGVAGVLAVSPAPADAHHSFAMYDSGKPSAITGVVLRNNPDSFHYQIFIAELNADHTTVLRDENGEPIIWTVEMAEAAVVASQGVTPDSFPAGTIVSVGFYPLRNGDPGGVRNEFGLYSCPANTPPPPGEFCDTVEGSKKFGEGVIPEQQPQA